MKYTNQEIQHNINVLTDNLEKLKLQRTEISKNITSIKKQILTWQELDKSQLKMF